MSKILVVGRMKYGNHEVNIIQPILDRLYDMGHRIQRVGGTMDFFLKENYPYQAQRWLSDMPLDFSDIDLVLVTDFWFPALPIYVYQATVTKGNVPFVGLFHGASWLEGDFVEGYCHVLPLEEYLLMVYRKVIVSAEWAVDELPKGMLLHRYKFGIHKFPMDAHFMYRTPRPVARRVIYNARWEYDKAPERFVEFAELCKAQHKGIEFVSFNNPYKDDLSRAAHDKGLIRFTGYPLQPEELERELRQGGYIWNMARQELTGYSVLEMVARGLTPLVFDDAKLRQGLGFADDFYFKTYADAMKKIDDGLYMSDADWKEFVSQNKDNADKIAQAIVEVM